MFPLYMVAHKKIIHRPRLRTLERKQSGNVTNARGSLPLIEKSKTKQNKKQMVRGIAHDARRITFDNRLFY